MKEIKGLGRVEPDALENATPGSIGVIHGLSLSPKVTAVVLDRFC